MSTTLLEEVPPPRLTPVEGVKEGLQRRWARPGGRAYAVLRWSGATVFAVIVTGLVVSLVASASQAFGHSGLSFLWSGTYNATKDVYPTGIYIIGTLITTAAPEFGRETKMPHFVSASTVPLGRVIVGTPEVRNYPAASGSQ